MMKRERIYIAVQYLHHLLRHYLCDANLNFVDISIKNKYRYHSLITIRIKISARKQSKEQWKSRNTSNRYVDTKRRIEQSVSTNKNGV